MPVRFTSLPSGCAATPRRAEPEKLGTRGLDLVDFAGFTLLVRKFYSGAQLRMAGLRSRCGGVQAGDGKPMTNP